MRLLILFSIALSYHLCFCQPKDNRSRKQLKKPEHETLPKDGTCTPEMLQAVKVAKTTVNFINDTYYSIDMTMLKRYLVDRDPWELLKAFRLDETDVCFDLKCFKIRDILEEIARETRIDLRNFLTEEKSKKSEERRTVFFKDAHLIHDDLDHIILNVSREVIPRLDQANYFMNKVQRDMERLRKKTLQDLSREIPCQLLTLDSTTDRRYGQPLETLVPEYTEKIQNDFTNKEWSDRLMTNLIKVWEQGTASKSTLVKSLMTGFTRESYFELADRLVDALQDVADSPKLGQELLTVLDTVVKNVRTIDFNNLTTVHYEAFMELRTTLMNMNVDVVKLVEDFDEIARVVQKRYWQFKTGRWPAMEYFVRKLLESMETDEFWTRVQQQYDRLIPALEKMYKPYEDTLIDWIVTKLRPFEVKAVEYLEKFAEEIGTTKLTIVDDIRKFNTTEMLYKVSRKVIDTVTEKLSKMCDGKEKGLPVFILQWFGLGDHDEKITKTREALKNIFTEGWSEKEMTYVEEVKKEFDELIKRTNTLIGKCPK